MLASTGYTAGMTEDVNAEVLFNRRLSEAYNVVGLAAPSIARAMAPGQFVMIKPREGLDPLLRRPFSVFERLTAPDGSFTGITILNKRIGRGTSLLYGLDAGERVQCLGPLGQPFVPPPATAEAWMVAGGVGLAPFASLADATLAAGATATLFYGARTAADLHCRDIFQRPGITTICATEDGSHGHRGFVTGPLIAALSSLGPERRVTIYACGPTPMMRAVSKACEHAGRDVFVSLEQVMGCGLGGCYSCVVRVRKGAETPHFVRSCLAGPVFKGSEVVWHELTH